MDSRNVKVISHSKHEYEFSIGDLKLGIWERSEMRNLIEIIDNKINTGLCDKRK